MSKRRVAVPKMLPSSALRRVAAAASRKYSAGPSTTTKVRPRGPLTCRRAEFGRRWYSEEKEKAKEPVREPEPEVEYIDAVQQSASGARDRAAVGVFTPTAAAIFVATGIGLFWYFKSEKEKLQKKKQEELEQRSYGRAKVGGPFSLTTHTGQPFTEKDLLGKWTLLYFGFTNCPDICPAEMDKMGDVVERIDKQHGGEPLLHPVFISVDPARDTSGQIARYLADFHPRFTGLSGDYAATKATCKSYRVYFSTPKDAKPTDDYLVDHSIFIYLMDPDGQFVEAFGQSTTVDDIVKKFEKEFDAWNKARAAQA
ncbi:SCO1 protein [Punctularia strigosozonata HHB-11173 SS5]|uniref:SCO1 protein n=1 Tax=Punctularia strigosozonata (strain HHB-11173) TaxID=741275 RepID=R7S1U3_PUNST|nr:SCO1 protein [Punctularia strigosozonata HHB-11173 SS5]EIN04375.1 SCO1 protein [Punctularia strigosozonata HHB-11173 SS5]